jgi:FHS family L-fucose permease-like MFS transporter
VIPWEAISGKTFYLPDSRRSYAGKFATYRNAWEQIRASALLAGLSVLACVLCLIMIASPDMLGVWALVAISACLSLMFPTIYGVALEGLGDDTKFGAAGLVMAILGGAILPLAQGAMIDSYGSALSFIVPALCFLVVGRYGLFDLKSSERKAGATAIAAV